MELLTTISKTTEDRISKWSFMKTDDDQYFAIKGNYKVLPCKDRDDLRALYHRMTTNYGFTKV
tara:strand:+ start:1738 stop:1926 length:189 start_codon:yes stop_codon:yes gene_type:complete